MKRIADGHSSIKCESATASRSAQTEVTAVPFRKYAASFTPEQLEILTSALQAATAELNGAGFEISQSILAQRILSRAADGIFDVAELKRAALDGSNYENR